MVFDCSAKFQETSFNDDLLTASDLTNTSVGVLRCFLWDLLQLCVTLKECSTSFMLKGKIMITYNFYGGRMETWRPHHQSTE